MPKRTYDARPDAADFRDRMYVPTLVEVQPEYPLATYRRSKVPILNQGNEGACTGYALATVCHYLFRTLDTKATTEEGAFAVAIQKATRIEVRINFMTSLDLQVIVYPRAVSGVW